MPLTLEVSTGFHHTQQGHAEWYYNQLAVN